MAVRDLLLEIGLEEMPAKFMPPALAQLRELAEKGLQSARLTYGKVEVFGTPRRLAIRVADVAEMQADVIVEAKGPAKKVAFDGQGQPTKAALGFARSQGVDVADLTEREIGGVPYLYACRTEKGGPAGAVLTSLLASWIHGLTFPKPMRWGWGEMRFARPIRWLVALFGAEVLPLTLEGVTAGNKTFGHRFLSGAPVEIAEPTCYEEVLASVYVIAAPEKRQAMIWSQMQELAASVGGQVAEDADLLQEITYILEYPTALLGQVDGSFMHLPEPVLITPMKEHQRYFPVYNSEGRLMDRFIAVRNGTADHLATVQAGNEKVLRARLADAAFFYAEDQKVRLADRKPKLGKIVFQETLGTVEARVERECRLTTFLAEQLQVAPEVQARAGRAAFLAKTDLVTHMVYEFPELQGIMGERYALLEGEDAVVAQAIREHYQPRFAGDAVPSTMEGTLVALADKLDAIVGSFAIGIIPTGSQDPYALRRQALGICQILIQQQLPLSLSAAIAKAYELYADAITLKRTAAEVQADLADFFQQRLRFLLTEKGVRYDVIDAVLASGADVPTDVVARAEALTGFRQAPAFAALTAAYTRAANLVKKGGSGEVNVACFQESVEGNLWSAVQKAQAAVAAAGQDYSAALRAIAEVRPAVDAFFDGVMVMAEDATIRQNRLALLGAVVGLTGGIADLSKIVE
ncbi:glycyl-tRNA synthetase beta chain [Heliophilum fasciatum]|uniref:Glycine--tRNA ligase beta subunit n=1 Tax=Heliophilum fasciatum TaxID=35700 RepID=A0A4R2RNF5_9FIRM|nr:glycyl-tRNA synthetase beta chain [Heliophilum fasciatum]TCP64219.1 glycyl-tRNA synthetase beta chain [Heliophilum fasciatum]